MSEHQIASPFIDVSRGEIVDVELLKSLMEDPSAGQHENSKLSDDATCGRTWRVLFKRTFLRL